MLNDGLFFLVILLLFFGLWLVSGGPTKPISFAGPYITPVTNVGVNQTGYGGAIDLHPSLHAYISSPSNIRGSLSDAYDSLADLQKKVEDLKLYGTPSPYKGQVYLGRGAFTEKVLTEYITLSVSGSADSDISVTGWKLVSVATGDSATIGQGVEVPQTGRVNSTGPIVLHPGDEAILATKESPIGVSFRENICTGYLNKYQDFSPELPRECPAPLSEFNRYYTGNKLSDDRCYNLMRDTSTCEVPDDSGRLSGACFNLIDAHFGYNNCVASHQYEPDFKGDTWHIYFNRDKEDDALWKQSREAIKLIDASGKTVDVYEY